MSAVSPVQHSGMQRCLDLVERVGNKVPHPTVIFLITIAILIVLSHLFYLLGVTINYQVVNPQTHDAQYGFQSATPEERRGEA